MFKMKKVDNLSISSEEESKKPSNKLERARTLMIAEAIILVSILAVVSTLARTGTQIVDNANPPIPVIMSQNARTAMIGGDFCMVVYAKIKNGGGPGTVMVVARVGYETSSVNTFERTGSVYLNSNETRDLTFIFPEVIPLPCGNRHSIRCNVWVTAP